MQLKNTSLDSLFSRWITSYPAGDRSGFHRDGAVDEATYWHQKYRILFLMTEPNSKGGAYDHYWGWDLRYILGHEELGKEFNLNLGLWVAALLDGETTYHRLSPFDAQTQIRRVAAVNLKKIGGHGTADIDVLTEVAMRDRDFILEEIATLDPHFIVTCGPKANRVFGRACTNNKDFRASDDDLWRCGGLAIQPGNSPSLRPYQAEPCFSRLLRRAQKNKLAAFSAL